MRRDNVARYVENVLQKPPSDQPTDLGDGEMENGEEKEKEKLSKKEDEKRKEDEKAKEASTTMTTTTNSTDRPTGTASSKPQPELPKCTLNHSKDGFDNEIVYAWRGPYKGRFGMCRHMSGLLAAVSLGSAFQGEGITYILRSSLIAYVFLPCAS